jgi:uncharacterized membrane protein YphA (DoxX/SURF4 family)
MENIYNTMQKYSSLVLRVGLALVMLYFGSAQLMNPAPWMNFLPDWTKSLPISHINFIYLNGWFEIIAGLMLLTGFYTRIVAGLLALHLIGITMSIGYSATGVRDFGLTIALFAIFLQGESIWSLDEYFK